MCSSLLTAHLLELWYRGGQDVQIRWPNSGTLQAKASAMLVAAASVSAALPSLLPLSSSSQPCQCLATLSHIFLAKSWPVHDVSCSRSCRTPLQEPLHLVTGFNFVMQRCARTRESEKEDKEETPEEMEKIERIANQHWLCALDHALLGGSGIDLAFFQSLRPLAALSSSQRRSLAPENKLVPNAETMLFAV